MTRIGRIVFTLMINLIYEGVLTKSIIKFRYVNILKKNKLKNVMNHVPCVTME